jgi:hypothetical protein
MPVYRVVVYEVTQERPNGAARERLIPVIHRDISDKPDAHCALVAAAEQLDAEDHRDVTVLPAASGKEPQP